MEVIVLAAGKGTRMKTDLPKVLHKLCGQTLLERVMRAALSVDPTAFRVVIGYAAELVRDEIANLSESDNFCGRTIRAIKQEPQMGTGHAVQVALAASPVSGDHVLIVPGDMPLIGAETLKAFSDFYFSKSLDLAVLSFAPCDAGNYGRVIRDSNNRLTGIVEAKDCSSEQLGIGEVNSSIYLVKADLLSEGINSLRPDNAQKELYLTDIVSWGSQSGYNIDAFCAHDAMELSGANMIGELVSLERHRQIELVEQFMAEGVRFENPMAVYLDEAVVIEHDCWIGANSRLRGNTIVKCGTVIQGDCLIVDTKIGENSTIRFGCVLENSAIGRHCSIGPFAHLRPETKLSDDVKIGNFVETKKSEISRGSKVNHLSYIGDAHLGEDVNVGAGTITCNYDGKNKHKTIIEDCVFIGSNAALVAPVSIGKGAVIGAGSVITSDVSQNALAIARGRQTEISDWKAKKGGNN